MKWFTEATARRQRVLTQLPRDRATLAAVLAEHRALPEPARQHSQCLAQARALHRRPLSRRASLFGPRGFPFATFSLAY